MKIITRFTGLGNSRIISNVLFQYVLALLWFMHVIGICVSVFGLVKHMVKIIWNDCIPALDGSDVTKLYSRLSIRERELMDYIRMKNIPMFGELMKRIEQRYDTVSSLPGNVLMKTRKFHFRG